MVGRALGTGASATVHQAANVSGTAEFVLKKYSGTSSEAAAVERWALGVLNHHRVIGVPRLVQCGTVDEVTYNVVTPVAKTIKSEYFGKADAIALVDVLRSAHECGVC